VAGKYEQDLGRTAANHAPLTPLSFIERAAAVYPQRLAVVDGDRRFTWKDTYARCRRLASGLAGYGIGAGDTVAAILPNISAMYEAHFGVAMCGAVLNAINIRLNAEAIAFMLEHGEAKLLIADRELSGTVERVLGLLKEKIPVIDVEDPQAQGGTRLGAVEYESFLAGGDPEFAWRWPEDESCTPRSSMRPRA
jgi:fatty-acyl-CoA synthase